METNLDRELRSHGGPTSGSSWSWDFLYLKSILYYAKSSLFN